MVPHMCLAFDQIKVGLSLYGSYWPLVAMRVGFPTGASDKGPATNAGDMRDVGLIPGLGRSPGGGHGSPFQYSCLENSWPEEPGRLSPWGHTESDTTEVT